MKFILLLALVYLVASKASPGYAYCRASFGECDLQDIVSAGMYVCIQTYVQEQDCVSFFNSTCGTMFGCFVPKNCASYPTPWCLRHEVTYI